MNKNERMKFSNTLCKPLQKKSSKIFYLSNPFLPNVYFGFLMFSGKLKLKNLRKYFWNFLKVWITYLSSLRDRSQMFFKYRSTKTFEI